VKQLVLLHGWGADGRIWQRQVMAFEGRTTVLTPTLPAWDTDLLADYLQKEPHADRVLVGWSLGGMLLIDTLSQLETSPDTVVLVAAAASFCRRPGYPWGLEPAVVRAMRRGLRNHPRRVLEDFAHSCLGPGEEAFRAEAAAHFEDTAYPENLAPGLDYLLHKDLRDRLPRLRVRIIIVQGDEDRIVPPAQAQFLRERIPGARLELLEGAGHLPFFTQEQAFNRILEEAMAREGPGA
jgi:pimeloyl-ACP methyl ester carboxylesterase